MKIRKIVFPEVYPSIKHELPVAEAYEFAAAIQLRKYGSGERDGEIPKGYHNLLHVKTSVEAGMAITRKAVAEGKINQRQAGLILIALSFHDVEQQLGSGINEQVSANEAEKWMRAHKKRFNEDDIKLVESLIMGTVIKEENGKVSQMGDDQDLMHQIVCDCDLIVGGVDDWELFEKMSVGLYRETHPESNLDRFDGSDEAKKCLQSQIKFWQGRKFNTEFANNLYPNIECNVEKMKKS